jgi:hypothetical protein
LSRKPSADDSSRPGRKEKICRLSRESLLDRIECDGRSGDPSPTASWSESFLNRMTVSARCVTRIRPATPTRDQCSLRHRSGATPGCTLCRAVADLANTADSPDRGGVGDQTKLAALGQIVGNNGQSAAVWLASSGRLASRTSGNRTEPPAAPSPFLILGSGFADCQRVGSR